MAKRWWRKRQLRERYNTTDRTIERQVKAGILPCPHYPLGNKTPFWDADEVEASEQAALMAPRTAKPDRERNNAEAGKGVASKSKHRAEVTIAQS